MKKYEQITKLQEKINIRMQSDFSAEGKTIVDFINSIKNLEEENKMTSKYSLWIVRKYTDNGIQAFEDLSRVFTALKYYDRFKQKLEEKHRNIMDIKSLVDLENLVEPLAKYEKKKEQELLFKEKIYSETDFIYADDNIKLLTPKTKEASVFWGKGTKWCTASTSSRNYFADYNGKGPLYILILDKKDNYGREVKYQFHFETKQFMDTDDRGVQFKYVLLNTGLLEYVKNSVFFSKTLNYFANNNHEDLIKIFEPFLDEKVVEIFNIYNNLQKNINLQTKPIDTHVEDYSDNVFAPEPEKRLFSVPKDKITYELCVKYTEENPDNIVFVPQKYIDKKIIENSAASKCVFGFISEDMLDEELILKLAKYHDTILCLVENKFITKELCEKVLGVNNKIFPTVPNILKTKELCYQTVSEKPEMIKYVPNNIINEELYNIAFCKDKDVFSLIPDYIKTKEMCEAAILHNIDFINFVPKHFIDIEFAKYAIENKLDIFKYIPDEYKTKELTDEFIFKCNTNIENIDKKYITNKAILHYFNNNPEKIGNAEIWRKFQVEKNRIRELFTDIININPSAYHDLKRAKISVIASDEFLQISLHQNLMQMGCTPFDNIKQNLEMIFENKLYEKNHSLSLYFAEFISHAKSIIFKKNEELGLKL